MELGEELATKERKGIYCDFSFLYVDFDDDSMNMHLSNINEIPKTVNFNICKLYITKYDFQKYWKYQVLAKNVKQLALLLILVGRVELYSYLGQREFLTKLHRTLLYKPIIPHMYIYPTEIITQKHLYVSLHNSFMPNSKTNQQTTQQKSKQK